MVVGCMLPFALDRSLLIQSTAEALPNHRAFLRPSYCTGTATLRVGFDFEFEFDFELEFNFEAPGDAFDCGELPFAFLSSSSFSFFNRSS